MDVQMPEMNGYEATESIRELGIETPIVAVTASALKGEEEKCLKVGMNGFLVKPFKKRDLLPVLDEWFEQGHRSSAAALPNGSPLTGPAAEELEELEELEEIEELEETGEAEGAPEAELPYVNSDAVVDLEETLENFMGQREIVARVIEGFIHKVEAQLPEIEAALGARDFIKLRAEAHSIKGGGLNLAAVRLGKTAAALELAAVNEESEQAARLVELLHREFEGFTEECRKQL
jgi:CheY-like chemotaxis protein